MNSETRIHSTGSASVICQNCKKDFIIEPDDFGFYEKIDVLPPKLYPDYRSQLRLAFNNL